MKKFGPKFDRDAFPWVRPWRFGPQFGRTPPQSPVRTRFGRWFDRTPCRPTVQPSSDDGSDDGSTEPTTCHLIEPTFSGFLNSRGCELKENWPILSSRTQFKHLLTLERGKKTKEVGGRIGFGWNCLANLKRRRSTTTIREYKGLESQFLYLILISIPNWTWLSYLLLLIVWSWLLARFPRLGRDVNLITWYLCF